ncbi:hypothetical protein VTO73DRAFT_4678 [Trametes versicolor]
MWPALTRRAAISAPPRFSDRGRAFQSSLFLGTPGRPHWAVRVMAQDARAHNPCLDNNSWDMPVENSETVVLRDGPEVYVRLALSEQIILSVPEEPIGMISNARFVILHSPSVRAPSSDALPIADNPPVPAVNRTLTRSVVGWSTVHAGACSHAPGLQITSHGSDGSDGCPALHQISESDHGGDARSRPRPRARIGTASATLRAAVAQSAASPVAGAMSDRLAAGPRGALMRPDMSSYI